VAETLLNRFKSPALLALITGVWCWVVTALHGAWSLGVVRDYFEGGTVPLYPTIPVTYSGFFMMSLVSLFAALVLTFLWSSFAPKRFVLAGLVASWIAGFWFGADQISFNFQADFGSTWAPTEAFRTLFWHPIVTPFVLIFGPFSAATLTRRWR